MPTTYIIGHQKPDTDSVVAALACQYLFQTEADFGYEQPVAAIVDPLNPETSYLFDRFKMKTPPQLTATDLQADDQVVLVDHNEAAQRLPDLNQELICEIIDHHKINLNLKKPISATFRTWGSTNTIIYDLMERVGVKPDQVLASLMLAAILSDTVGFKSATTTEKDRKAATALAELAEIDDIEEFTLDIFKAKSDLSALSDQELVQNDYKVYQFKKQTFINQIETVEQSQLLQARKTDLLEAMQTVKAEKGVDLLFVALTDIMAENTKLLAAGETEVEIAEAAFGTKAQEQIIDIGPKMSRKKEIAPAIEQALAEKY